jgi:argininosuccinate lyase
MTQLYTTFAAVTLLLLSAMPVWAQKNVVRDEFYWLGQMNKATTIINSEEGLLDKAIVSKIAVGIAKVLEDGGQAGASRPSTVITFEPVLIKVAGQDVTWLHAGRSSQDMHATFRAAILKDDLLALGDQLNKASEALVRLAEQHAQTVVPNYTNGVAAQPNSYGHYLLGHAAGFERDTQRLPETYARIDRSAMGTTVLNGSSWPLNRNRMAKYLGFSAVVDNAYDAGQISSTEHPVEVGAVITGIALHVGHFVEDVMTQYAYPRPWILLQEGGGNTYVSSAMPQKRNPGLLNDTRRDASTAIALAIGPLLRAHNITPGMVDAKDSKTNTDMVKSAIRVLQGFDKILNSLVISPERALEELNSDWTASQELADLLMRKYKLPFRLGHNFASEVVDFAKLRNIKPLEFPYEEAKRIYKDAVKDYPGAAAELPMSYAEFKESLNPTSIVQNRQTSGGPQSAEMKRMVTLAKKNIKEQAQWIQNNKDFIDNSLKDLDRDFAMLIKAPG